MVTLLLLGAPTLGSVSGALPALGTLHNPLVAATTVAPAESPSSRSLGPAVAFSDQIGLTLTRSQIGDFDNDGVDELLVLYVDAPKVGLVIYQLDTFAQEESWEVDGIAGATTKIIGDYDGDGLWDIFFTYFNVSLHVVGYEMGGAGELFDLPAPWTISVMELTDTDLDGTKELVLITWGPWTLRVFDASTGVSAGSTLIPYRANWVSGNSFVDADGDLHLDYVYAGQLTFAPWTRFMRMVDLVDFSETANITFDMSPSFFWVGDVDDDLANEALMLGTNSTTFRNGGSAWELNGTNVWARSDPSWGWFGQIGIADLNDDGVRDLAFQGAANSIVILDGIDGTTMDVVPATAQLWSGALRDFDGDGAMELLFLTWSTPQHLVYDDQVDGVRWDGVLANTQMGYGVNEDLDGDGSFELMVYEWATGPEVWDLESGTVDFPLPTITTFNPPSDAMTLLDGTVVGKGLFVAGLVTGVGFALSLYDGADATLLWQAMPGAMAFSSVTAGGFAGVTKDEVVVLGTDLQNRLRLWVYVLDDPPAATAAVPDLSLTEDAPASVLADLEDSFGDDYGDGALTFTLVENSDPDQLDVALNGSLLQATPLVQDWNGNVTVQIAVDDGLHAPLLSNEFTVSVLPVNDPPTWMAPPAQTIDQDQQLQVRLQADDVDLDDLTFSGDLPAGATISGDLLRWTPTNADVGDYLIDLTVEDGAGGMGNETIFVRVLNVNDPPTIASMSGLTVEEDSTLEVELSATDPDLPYDDLLTYSSLDGRATVNATSGLLTFTPHQGEAGTVLLTVLVEDLAGLNASGTLEVSVGDRNVPPALRVTFPDAVVQGMPALFVLIGTDIDTDDALTYGVTAQGGGVAPLQIDASSGQGLWTPTNDQVGSHPLVFFVNDDRGGRTEVPVSVVVQNANDPPTIAAVGNNTTLTEGTPWSLGLLLDDPDLPYGETLRVTTDRTAVAVSTDGTQLNWTPTQADVGTVTLEVTVTDAAGATMSVGVELKVRDRNDPPTGVQILAPANNATLLAGEVTLVGTATDPDVGDVLVYHWVLDGAPLAEGEQASATITKTGRHTLTLQVSDGPHTAETSIEFVVHSKVQFDASGTSGLLMGGLLALVVVVALCIVGMVLLSRKLRQAQGGAPPQVRPPQHPPRGPQDP